MDKFNKDRIKREDLEKFGKYENEGNLYTMKQN